MINWQWISEACSPLECPMRLLEIQQNKGKIEYVIPFVDINIVLIVWKEIK